MPVSTAKLLILIPAYNAGGYLAELAERLRSLPDAPDILIIDDGSTDGTPDILAGLGVTALTNRPNRGKGYSLRRGFEYAAGKGYRYVVTIDADLQHRPEEIPRFLNYAEEADLYIGTRCMDPKKMPWERRLTNNLTSLIISIFSGCRIRDSQSGYRMFKTDLLKTIRTEATRYDFESEILFKAGRLGARVAEIPISTVYGGSRSYINPLVDTGRFIRLVWKRIVS